MKPHNEHMLTPGHRLRIIITSLIMVVVCFGVYGIALQSDSLAESAMALRAAEPQYVTLALLAIFVSYAASALLYVVLALRRLRFGSMLLLQLSNLLVNRVLPSGVGALGMNYLYLRTHKHKPAEAGLVIVANNTIGFFGHMLLLALLSSLAFAGLVSVPAMSMPALRPAFGIPLLLVVCVVISCAYLLRHRIVRAMHDIRLAFRRIRKQYMKHPQRIAVAFGAAWVMTGAQAATLWLSCLAIGIDVAPLAVFIIFTFGIVALAVTPLPGGLGGVEAALVAGLVSIGINAAMALAAVLLYRLLTFWLGLAIGAVALRFVAARGLVVLHKH